MAYINLLKITINMLNDQELQHISYWKYNYDDKTWTTKVFTPLWNFQAYLTPKWVVPNIITLTGFLCILYSYFLTYNWYQYYPVPVSITVSFLTFTYLCLDAVDGKQARKTNNSTPVGELFDHLCDNIGSTFLCLTLFIIIGIDNFNLQWYIIQTVNLIFMSSHIKAYMQSVVTFDTFSDTTLILLLYISIILSSNYINYPEFYSIYKANIATVAIFAFYVSVIYILYQAANINKKSGLILLYSIIAMYIVPYFLHINNIINYSSVGGARNAMEGTSDLQTVICQGIVLSIMTSDIIVSKMAKSYFHNYIPVILLLASMNNFISFFATVIYQTKLFSVLTEHLKINMFKLKKNVYVGGIFDSMTVDDINFFNKAVSYGDRLIIGIYSDATVLEDGLMTSNILAAKYRYMNAERYKNIDKIIVDAPLILDEQFITDNCIDVVAVPFQSKFTYHDTNYNNKLNLYQVDKYYAVPRKMGILKIIY